MNQHPVVVDYASFIKDVHDHHEQSRITLIKTATDSRTMTIGSIMNKGMSGKEVYSKSLLQ